MMPDLVRAISATVLPSRAVWSSEIGVKTATCPSPTLVESHSPPMPTSMTATSTVASAKQAKASTVMLSKKVSRGRPSASSAASVISMYGRMSSQLRASASLLIGAPSITMRSLKRTRCGLVNRPTRRPYACRMLAAMRLVEVLPFVPVTWMIGYERCGSPSNSTARRVASSRGCGFASPRRVSSASYTASPAAVKSSLIPSLIPSLMPSPPQSSSGQNRSRQSRMPRRRA
jgi:hypothetical protein